MTLTELKNALQVKIDIVKSSGQDLVDAILYPEIEQNTEHNKYELKEI